MKVPGIICISIAELKAGSSPCSAWGEEHSQSQLCFLGKYPQRPCQCLLRPSPAQGALSSPPAYGAWQPNLPHSPWPCHTDLHTQHCTCFLWGHFITVYQLIMRIITFVGEVSDSVYNCGLQRGRLAGEARRPLGSSGYQNALSLHQGSACHPQRSNRQMQSVRAHLSLPDGAKMQVRSTCCFYSTKCSCHAVAFLPANQWAPTREIPVAKPPPALG